MKTMNFKKLLSIVLAIVMVAACVPFTALAEDTALPASELQNLYLLLNDENETDLKVAYLGGSVTVGSGASDANTKSWRALVGQWFVDNFGPESSYGKNVTNVHAAIGATGSYFGAYRVFQDAKLGSDNPPDVLFVEFGINDIYDGISQVEVATYYESIIRQAYAANPKMNVIPVFTMDLTLAVNFVNNGDEGSPYFTTQRTIAEYYGLPQVNVGRALINVINDEYVAAGKTLTTADNKAGTIWRNYITDTCHPQDAGYKIYADTVTSYITEQLGDTVDHSASVDVKDLSTLTSYAATQGNEDLLIENGRYISFKDAGFTQADLHGWTLSTKTSASSLANSNGTITTNSNNASFAFKFRGTSVAFFNQGMPTSGTIHYTITSQTDTSKVYTGTKSLIKNYSTGLPIPAQIKSGLPEDDYLVECVIKTGKSGCYGQLRYIYIDGDPASITPATAPDTELPPKFVTPFNSNSSWGTSSTATSSTVTKDGMKSTLVKGIAGKSSQFENWNTASIGLSMPENKYVALTYYYDPGMETDFVPNIVLSFDRVYDNNTSASTWVSGNETDTVHKKKAPAVAGKWVTQYFTFDEYATKYSGKSIGSMAILPYGFASGVPADIKAEYAEKASFWFTGLTFYEKLPYLYNANGELITNYNDGSAIAYVSSTGEVTVGDKKLTAYTTLADAVDAFAGAGGTIKVSGNASFIDSNVYTTGRQKITIEGLDSTANLTNDNLAITRGDVELKNITMKGHSDEYWTYTSGNVLTIGENVTITNGMRPAATSAASGKPNIINFYSGKFGNFGAMGGYNSTFTVTGDTIYNIYGGQFTARINGFSREGLGAAKQTHNGNVYYNIYGADQIGSLDTATSTGVLNGNLIYTINGGKFTSGALFQFGHSQEKTGATYAVVNGMQAFIINNKEVKAAGGTLSGVIIGEKLNTGINGTTNTKTVIINNNELSVDTGAAISANTIADYNLLVNNGKLLPVFDDTNKFIGFEAIPDEEGSIPCLGTVAMTSDENGLYQLEKLAGETQIVNFKTADSVYVIYTDGTETATVAGKQNSTIAIGNCTFTKDGYSFNGWEAADGTVYYPGDTYALALEDVTLTARWVKTSDITTVYVKPGAVGTGIDPKFPAPTFKAAQALIGDTAKDFTIVVDGEMIMRDYNRYFTTHTGTITITGTENGILNYNSQLYFDGPTIVKNIKFRVVGSNNFTEAIGKPMVFGEGITMLPTVDGGSSTYLPSLHVGLIGPRTPYQYAEFMSGRYNNVYVGAYYNDTGAADDISEGARILVGGDASITSIIFRPDGYTKKQGKTEWTNAPSVVITGGTIGSISTKLYSETQGGKYNYPMQIVVNNGLETPPISDGGKAGAIIVKATSEFFVDVTTTPGVFKITTDKENFYLDGVLTEKTEDNLYTINTVGTHVIAAEVAKATFAADGGEGTAPVVDAVPAGSKITLPENTFTREGFTFAGWYDGKAVYAAGAQYSLEKDTTLKTMWTSADASVIYLSADGYVDTNFDGNADVTATKALATAIAAVPADGATIYVEGNITIPAAEIDTNANRGAVTICGINGATSAKLTVGLLYTGYVFKNGDATIDNITIKPAANEIWFAAQNGCTLTMGGGVVTETNVASSTSSFNIHMGSNSCKSDANYVINGGTYDKIMAAGAYTGGTATHTGTVRYTFNGGTFKEVYGGSRNSNNNAGHTSTGDRYYTFNGGTFNANIYTGSQKGDVVNGNVVFTVNGGKFNGKSIIAGHNGTSTKVAAVNAAVIVNNASFGEDDNINGTVIGRDGAGRGTITNEILIINNKEIATGASIHAKSTAGYKIHAYEGKVVPAFAEGVGGALLGFELTADVEGAVPYANGKALEKNENGYYTIPENKAAAGITNVVFVNEDDEYAVIGGMYTKVVDGTVTALIGGEINLDGVTKPEKEGAIFLGFKNETQNAYVATGSTVAQGDVIAPAFIEFELDEEAEGFNFGTLGAQVRLVGDPALRFVATVSEELLSAIEELNEGFKPESADETDIGFGYVVLPVHLLEGELTKETAEAAIVPAVKLFEETETDTKYTVCITNITSDKYARDYAVVPYVTFKDNYGTEHTVYGEQYSTNMAAVASAALDDPDREYTEDEIAALKLVCGR